MFCTFSFGHCVVCSSVFWPLCCLFFCLLAIVLFVLLSFGHCVVCSSVFWPLCCLFFCLLAIVLSVLLSFGHCVVCSSSIYGSWLPLWYLQTLLIIRNYYSFLNFFFIIIHTFITKLLIWVLYINGIHKSALLKGLLLEG